MKTIRLSLLALLFLTWASTGRAQYVTLGGVAVTQGQLRVDPTSHAAPTQIRELPSGQSVPEPGQFILMDTEVHVEVTEPFARVRLRQKFKNPYKDRLEAIYLFPLPEDSAVDGFSFEIGEKVIRGVVKKKEQARKEYNQAKQQGKKAALVEQERPNLFTQSVANIPPGADVVVNITYVHTLKINGPNRTFTFPMVAAPRYIPGKPAGRANVGRGWAQDTDVVPDASRIVPHYLPPGMQDGHKVKVFLKLDAGLPIQKITAVTHEVKSVVAKDKTKVTVQLKNKEMIANQDFILEYTVGGHETVLATQVHKSGKQGYFSVVLQPKHNVKLTEIAPRDVVLVLDKSGSMAGRAISQLRIFAENLLGRLNPQDTFQIVAFSDRIERFQPTALAATEQNIAQGQQYVRSIQANGGTEMLKALTAASPLTNGEKSKKTQYLIVVTDALVGNERQVLKYIADAQQSHLRVFPVAMGSAPNDYLIQRLGELGRGFSIRMANGDNAQTMAEKFAARVSYPLLTDLRLEFDGIKVTDVLPNPIPDLYADRPLVVMGRYRRAGKGKMKLVGNRAGKKFTAEVALALPKIQKAHDSLGSVWARTKIRHITNKDIGKPSGSTKREITQLGLDHQLVTAYTSFIAVEEKAPEKVSGSLKTHWIRSLIPEDMESLFGQGNGTKPTTTPAKPRNVRSASAPTTRPMRVAQHSRSRSSSGGGGGCVGLLSLLLSCFMFLKRNVVGKDQ